MVIELLKFMLQQRVTSHPVRVVFLGTIQNKFPRPLAVRSLTSGADLRHKMEGLEGI